MLESIEINSVFITLGQFLKLIGVIDTGGQAKVFLHEHDVWVNSDKESRRGRKLYRDDKIRIDQLGEYQIVAQ
ncbi:S4 domain-containing protein YaaA [Tepidibacillus marianensis]|uniref:S4 domain-containing protein YaaA n=1 Tax=Tepidibacillus marianensis TaxID=3131995 RepID=UPI0030D14B8C